MKALTAAEMREVDRLTTERYGIPSLQLMEAAGKNVADAVLREFSPGLPQRVTLLCGKCNTVGSCDCGASRHDSCSGYSFRAAFRWAECRRSRSPCTPDCHFYGA